MVTATGLPMSPDCAAFQKTAWEKVPLAVFVCATRFQLAGVLGTVALTTATCRSRRSCAAAPAGTRTLIVVPALVATAPAARKGIVGSIGYGASGLASSSVSSRPTGVVRWAPCSCERQAAPVTGEPRKIDALSRVTRYPRCLT